MKRITAPAKINLALVVGPRRTDGKHEVATILQRVALEDSIGLAPAAQLAVTGFPDDTIVTGALEALADAAGVEPAWHVEISKSIPVAAGLGGGSSDAASALQLANERLAAPLDADRLRAVAAAIGADVPYFLCDGPQLGTGDGSRLVPIDLPQDYWVVLVLPAGAVKASTREVYDAFDARDGADGFEDRKTALLEALARVGCARDLAQLPPNDLATSPYSERLRDAGAFRADVSGAGPCVYGLFAHHAEADAAARALRHEAGVWVVAPLWST